MSAGRSFHLGYSTITWGPTPELDKVFGKHRRPKGEPTCVCY